MIPTITRGDAMIDVNTLPACPVETTLTLISDKWKILIVRDLLTGTKRFSELRRSIGHIIDALWNWGEDYKAKLAA